MLPLLLFAPLAVAVPPSVPIEILVSGLQPHRGRVMVSMFDSEQAWREGRPVRSGSVDASADRVKLSFAAVPSGRYAVRAFYDVDGNGKLNTNPFGIPTEPVAFSNGAQPSFGPPQWHDAAFDVNAMDNRHEIRFAVQGARP